METDGNMDLQVEAQDYKEICAKKKDAGTKNRSSFQILRRTVQEYFNFSIWYPFIAEIH